MTTQELCNRTQAKLSGANLSAAGEKLAVQVNLTGKNTGVFYIEVLNGTLSVMPYEYIDRDGALSMTQTDYTKFLAGKLALDKLIASGKIKAEGNLEKIKVLESLVKAA